jgi:hypothetical protein
LLSDVFWVAAVLVHARAGRFCIAEFTLPEFADEFADVATWNGG